MSTAKVKLKADNPIERLYEAAQEIVSTTRKAFAEHGNHSPEIRLPILMHGTDMRVAIAAGPKIAARNAIELEQMKVTGKPVEPVVDIDQCLMDARALIEKYSVSLEEGEDASKQRDHCLSTIKNLSQVRRLI